MYVVSCRLKTEVESLTKKKLGLILIGISILCLLFVLTELSANMAHEGLHAGQVQTYRQPFYGHIIVVYIIGVLGFISFFTGIVLIIIHKING